MSNLQFKKFSEIDLNDPFFDSLKLDYLEFTQWFNKKALNDKSAFIFLNKNNKLDGFLYLKKENEELNDISPKLVAKERLKIGTFKINPHGTRLGERFIKKIFDVMIAINIEEAYVTLFEKHTRLMELFKKYGFIQKGIKETQNGKEVVLIKNLSHSFNDVLKDYPNVPINVSYYVLALYPKWHSRLLPDSILKNEDPKQIITDCSHTNSIHKIYLTSMQGTEQLKRGDALVIYRTNDGQGSAEYRSVATSICVVEEVKSIYDFNTLTDFLGYAQSYSIFTKQELINFFKSKEYKTIIKFTYNFALKKRIIRKELIENIGIPRKPYWGFFKITSQQYQNILYRGEINESFIINKT